jgi:restriction endonuclease S subunit
MSNWEKKSFQYAPIEIIDGDRGVNYPQKSDFTNEGYCLFLSTSNVTTTGFDFNSTDFISKEKDDDLRKGKLKKGDIVLTTRGTVGNVAFYNDTRCSTFKSQLTLQNAKEDSPIGCSKKHLLYGQVICE